MKSWNPYKDAFKCIAGKHEDELKRYLFLRLTGREANPPYDWTRNQEAPEEFLVWAATAGDESFQELFAACLKDMLDEHLTDWLNGTQGEERIVSRLLYIAEVTQATGAALVFQKALLHEGRPKVDVLSRMHKAESVPWGETLLHQALGALSILESRMPRGERRARDPFWRPILDGRFEDQLGLAKNLRFIALRALGRMGWKVALEEDLHHVLGEFDPAMQTGRGRNVIIRELATLINFFVQESKRQEGARTFNPKPTLIENPTPLSKGFQRFATRKELHAVLEEALKLLCESPKPFDNDVIRQQQWKSELLPKILTEISGLGVGDVVKAAKISDISRAGSFAQSMRLGIIRSILRLERPLFHEASAPSGVGV